MRLAQYFEHAYDPNTLTVRQIMEGSVLTVSPDAKGITIAEMMTERNFGAVPVVERDSTLVGLVSEFDLLRAIDEGKDLHHQAASSATSYSNSGCEREHLGRHCHQAGRRVRLREGHGQASVAGKDRRQVIARVPKAPSGLSSLLTGRRQVP